MSANCLLQRGSCPWAQIRIHLCTDACARRMGCSGWHKGIGRIPWPNRYPAELRHGEPAEGLQVFYALTGSEGGGSA